MSAAAAVLPALVVQKIPVPAVQKEPALAPVPALAPAPPQLHPPQIHPPRTVLVIIGDVSHRHTVLILGHGILPESETGLAIIANFMLPFISLQAIDNR